MADGEQGIKSASKTLNAFLDFCQKKFDLDDSRTVIFGYSQGAMQALDMSITRATPVRKVIALSGSLIPPNKEQIKKRIVSRPDILLLHGTKDNVINFNAARQTESILKESGFNVRLCAQNGMGHGRGEESAVFWAKAAWHTATPVKQQIPAPVNRFSKKEPDDEYTTGLVTVYKNDKDRHNLCRGTRKSPFKQYRRANAAECHENNDKR